MAGETARLILLNGLVDNEDGQERLEEGLRQLGEPGRVDVLRDAYVALDKDRRALVRSLVVGELRAAAEPADPEENGKRRLTIEEANARFFLDLEPTQAVAAVTGLERQNGVSLDVDEVWQAIREAARDPGGEAAREHAARMAESALSLAGADREVAELLAAYPMAVAGGATAPLAAAIGAIAALVRASDRFPVPRTAEDFGRWNVYDLTGPALDAAGAALAEDDGAAELLPELDELAGAMLARLADPAPWRAVAEEPDGVMRRRWQWASYAIQAVKARRLLRVHGPGKAPLDAVGLLSAEEAAALRAALSLPEPEAVMDWRWPDPVPVAAERAARMALETLLLTLEIEATQAPTLAMATLVAGLADEILRNPMARFETEPGVASSRDEPQWWFRLVQRLAAMANSRGVHAANLRLLWRLSRLACQPGGTSVGARWAASSAVAAGVRFGADIPVALADDLAEAQALGEGAAMAEARFRAWPAATLCAEGRYRDAQDLLGPLLEADLQGSWTDTALRYAYEAYAQLGNVGQAERLRVRQRRRTAALSAPLAAVQTKLAAADLLHAQIGLDMAEPGERVRPILRDALDTLARQEGAEACALRAEAEILLMLGGADAQEPDALTKRLKTAMAPLMVSCPWARTGRPRRSGPCAG